MVAIPAPAIFISSVNIKMGSNIILAMAPIVTANIANLGLPSALMTEFSP